MACIAKHDDEDASVPTMDAVSDRGENMVNTDLPDESDDAFLSDRESILLQNLNQTRLRKLSCGGWLVGWLVREHVGCAVWRYVIGRRELPSTCGYLVILYNRLLYRDGSSHGGESLLFQLNYQYNLRSGHDSL